ncbi:12374_t:CDS:2 [Entrophospora sp. SA101]|nr:12374_t:CDS:2 [Entrophospora sp. SA101]
MKKGRELANFAVYGLWKSVEEVKEEFNIVKPIEDRRVIFSDGSRYGLCFKKSDLEKTQRKIRLKTNCPKIKRNNGSGMFLQI